MVRPAVMTSARTSAMPAAGRSRRETVAFGIASALLLIALGWAYAPTILPLIRDWRGDEDYSVGQLVPFAALYLLWNDRKTLASCKARPCWWGVGLILLAQAAWAYGLMAMRESAERYALVLTIAGVVLFVAGRQIFWRVRWILLLLLLMVPLPNRIHNLISGPLQNLAATGAVATLELLGIGVSQEGTQIILNNRSPLNVAEACSGLRMLTAFAVVASVLAYIVNRPKWQKAVLVCSSIPVAILCNLVRLVVTAVLFLAVSSEVAEKFFHDFAGWTMMPLAVFMLVAEMWIMSRLIIEEKGERIQACA